MPAERDDTATLVLIDGFLTYAVKWHSVEIDRISELEMTEVKADYGWVVVAYALDVRTATVATPAYAVYGVVVVTKHVSCLELMT